MAVDLEATGIVGRDLPTDAEKEALIEYVQGHGELRRAQQPDFNAIDYVAGAMAVLYALGWETKVPARWSFGPFIGVDPLTGKRL